MADTVKVVTIYDGPQYCKIHMTNKSDGTGESLVVKVDPAALAGAPQEVAISKIAYGTTNMSVELYWDATTPELIMPIPPNYSGELEFMNYGMPGLTNWAGTGKTGKIKLTTKGAAAGTTYALTLWLRKKSS
jgi:hypothetical protein